MYQTTYGPFDGDSWERLCQICFRLRYADEGYQPIEASPGDFGIEGFTRTGKAFQCYCPDTNYTADELYEKQRDKITKDLGKLVKYENELLKYLGKVRIKQWMFVSPDSRKKDLILHCTSKAEEYRKRNLPHLDTDFDILFIDILCFAKELPIALGQVKTQIELNCKRHPSDADIADWQSTASSLVSNALRKHRARYSHQPEDIGQRVQDLTTMTIRDYLEGNEKLVTWEELHQDRYERFQKVTSRFERKVEEKCLLPVSDNNKLIEEIKSDLACRLEREFPELDLITVEDLSQYSIAKWILECTVDFR
jgi:hypothetical protein